MNVSVLLTTFRNPRALEMVLAGYANQVHPDFELVVADDGSGPETERLVRRWRGPIGQAAVHVWHPDRGFRKTEILNKAILSASGDYLIFSDGDCVPRSDFVRTHVQLARPGRFLSGGYIKLSERLTTRITSADVASGRVFVPAWLRAQGWRDGKRIPRLTGSRVLAAVLDRTTTTRPTWNGHNSSGSRDNLVAVNGFDLDMGYGGLDRALGERLENLGIRGLQVRYRAVCLHLWHPRPYMEKETMERNRDIRERIRREGELRAARGLEQTSLQPETEAGDSPLQRAGGDS